MLALGRRNTSSSPPDGQPIRRGALARSGRLTRLAALGTVLLGGSWAAGRAVALGGVAQYGVLAVALAILGWVVGRVVLGAESKSGILSVELPVLLMAVSVIVLRQRTANQLAFDPLDPAGLFRVACVGAALALGLAALIAPPLPGTSRRSPLTSLPVRIYGLYAVVAFVGALLSVNPLLTIYRIVELTAAVVVLLGAYRAVGHDATHRVEATIYWFIVAQLVVVWIGLLLMPDRALVYKPSTADSPLKFQLEGAMPVLAANHVGMRGVVLATWSLARMLTRDRSGRRCRSAPFLAFFGVVTVILSQYRTGYGAVVLGAVVLFGLRRRAVLVGGAVVAVALVLAVPRIVETVMPFALRGQSTETAAGLSNRLNWWGEALEVWDESPVFGRGLLTASRFEVLAKTAEFQGTYGIHSTWVESLVGTGAAGFTLLALAVVVTLRRAHREARKPGGAALPLILVIVILVNSVTSSALESFTIELLLFLAIAISLPDPNAPVPARHGLVVLRV